MIKVVSNDQMRGMDNQTIKKLNVPGLILMENAGRHTFEYIDDFITDRAIEGRIDIYCGKGNNGGDGYVTARHLFNHGYEIQIISIGNPDDLQGDAKVNYQICKNYKIPLLIIQSEKDLPGLKPPGLIVDALLGIGIKGEVRGLFKSVIEHINTQDVPVVAVDIPSGLNGDMPAVSGGAVRADMTVTMALPKRAHLFFPAKKFVGQLEIADISMPDSVQNSENIPLNLVDFFDIIIPEIREDDHKYTAGKLFILAGSTGMTGAASLAASAALRTGVGLINVGIPESLNNILEVKLTEALTVPLPETKTGCVSKTALAQIKERIEWADAVVIGPGSGREVETLEVLKESIRFCLDKRKLTLVDADALFALSKEPDLINALDQNFILTPHHGEFRRLSSFSKTDIEAMAWQCLEVFLSDKKFCLNLKGAPSMVGSPDGQIYINPTGNAGLAKGGSGDVLAGIIGGLLAKGLDPVQAGITGNYIHGKAADLLLSTTGKISILPTDLIEVLPELFNIDNG